MLVDSFILPPSFDYPLFIAAKRYRLPGFAQIEANPLAQTLVVLHSTSFHKETWEPALEDLFRYASQPGSTVLIREVWAIDCPNHGESGHLNYQTLKDHPDYTNFSCEKYAQAVHRFLSAGPTLEARVDFTQRNLTGIGHSLGANAMLLLHHIMPVFRFSKLVIIEPLVSPLGSMHLASLAQKLVNRASRRRECWTSREEIKRSFLVQGNSSAQWDMRVLDSFVTHAFHRNPYDNLLHQSCTIPQEISMYLDEAGGVAPLIDLDRICHSIPVHLILGAIPDFIPTYLHKALIDPASGRRFASIITMENVGHLIPQKAPTTLALHIFNAISTYIPSRM
ncbi:hypothetical protein JR316_0005363 [Psilocybe cubensis]|uniref:AB hydrolase-1 domain-containing protein n=2 Tax=Psilocybe cubensis TaxID=181762 RepID=A0A8H8CE86_PSICU|nr:hypothetical protein JR316_0005363 [Psilocybe cubensis]KAH9483259.1 hypothetical protein JR316_0005363 [Psilocybe cubensis]